MHGRCSEITAVPTPLPPRIKSNLDFSRFSDQKFLFTFHKIVISDIIGILWPVKLFWLAVLKKKVFVVHLNLFFYESLETGKLSYLLNPLC